MTLLAEDRKVSDIEMLLRNLTKHLGQEPGYDAWISHEQNFDIDDAFEYAINHYNACVRKIALSEREGIYSEFAQELQKIGRLGYISEDLNGNPRFSSLRASLEDKLHDVVYEHIKEERPYGSDIHGRIPPAVGGILGKSRRKLKGYE